jgi:hypothetical protein
MNRASRPDFPHRIAESGGMEAGLSDFPRFGYPCPERMRERRLWMSAARFFGWVLVLAGAGLALRDALAPWIDHTRFHPVSFGAVIAWSRLVPLIDETTRLVTCYFFDPVGGWLETIWAFAVLLGAGILVLVLDGRGTGRRHRR